MQLAALKRQALDQKHLLQRYLAIYDAFQKFVETLTPLVRGKTVDQPALMAAERFRLLFAEYEPAFCEWHDGDKLVNAAIATFLYHPNEFRDNEEQFRTTLLLATAKFEDLLSKAGRDLKEVHEQIALEENQSKAEAITKVPSSALSKLKDTDVVAEIATKWLGRAVQFAPWVYEVLKNPP